jgi:hypothetical protein
VIIPPRSAELSRRAAASSLNSPRLKGRDRRARGVAGGKEKAPGKPAAKRRRLRVLSGFKLSRWGMRTAKRRTAPEAGVFNMPFSNSGAFSMTDKLKPMIYYAIYEI